jgi:hypothetical protein
MDYTLPSPLQGLPTFDLEMPKTNYLEELILLLALHSLERKNGDQNLLRTRPAYLKTILI